MKFYRKQKLTSRINMGADYWPYSKNVYMVSTTLTCHARVDIYHKNSNS